jgi:hypothetical protein
LKIEYAIVQEKIRFSLSLVYQQRESICNSKQDNKSREKPEISYPVSDEEDSDYCDKSDELALIRDVDQLKGPAVPGLREIIPSRSDYRTPVSHRS